MKNTYFNGKVIDYTHDGKGVVKNNGIPIFVKNTLVNEEVEIKVVKSKKKYGFGKVINILNESNNRLIPKCPYFQRCGGCQLQHMNYDEQLLFKEKKIQNAYQKQGIQLNEIDIIESSRPFNYRNKLSIPLQKNNGVIEVGLYQENSNHLIAIDKCLIQEEVINDVLISIVQLLNKYNIDIYDKERHNGYLRQIVLRCNTANNQILVGFVVNHTRYFGELDRVIDELKNNVLIKTIVVNFNSKNTNVILGDKSKVIYGDGYIIDELDGMKFQISLNSFYQVNSLQMIELYKKAIEFAKITKNDIVLDAYCGVGTISSYIAREAKKVIGVDIVQAAINDANDNKELNSLNHLSFECMDVNEYMKTNKNIFDIVMIDPPRKGCSIDFLEALIEMEPKKIVYIACDVATQARDVKYLIENGYSLISLNGVDMFSQTHHVESVALLIKGN